MARIDLDINLQTVPDSEERDAELAELASEMGLSAWPVVKVSVVREHGPAGGAQVVLVEGPREEVEKAVRWWCELANDADGWEEFAAEYVVD